MAWNRKRGLLLIAVACIVIAMAVAGPWNRSRSKERNGKAMSGRMEKSEAEWRALLSPEEFRVTRRKGTERAFSGSYWNTKDDGIYRCVCCGQPLFDANTKFDSGTGWPSFWQPMDADNVSLHEDNSWFTRRTEVICSRCDAHLGHVFEDGPEPTGQRYCINSASLRFAKREDAESVPAEPGETGMR